MSEPNRPLKIFLCHASADKPTVRELYKRLESDGADAWLDSEDLIPGQNWRVEIPTAVENSDIVLVCISENSVNKEGYVQKEISFALDKALEMPEGRIFLIPVRLESCEVPRRLSDYQWVDLFSENGYERLMLALKLRAEQIGAEPPGRKGWLPKIGSKPIVSKPRQDISSVPTDKEAPKKVATVPPPESEKAKDKKTERPQLKAKYIVAIIGIMVTITAAVIGLPLIERWFPQASEPTATIQAKISSTDQFVPIVVTKTLPPKLVPTDTFTIVPTVLPSEIADSNGVEMVLVPEGKFIMGSNDGKPGEGPAHQVFLNAYYIDKYEVTNALYKICVEASACVQPANTSKYKKSEYGQHPVTYVNWGMANDYCEWRGARLPTEAEWEKAARGTDERTYPWGEEIDCSYANYWGKDGGCVGGTAVVGGYEKGKSPYDAYDMAGNVWEWVADWYEETYYEISPFSNPQGPERGDTRVIRGRSWYSYNPFAITDMRSVIRTSFFPSVIDPYTGFRCVRSP